MVKAVFVSSAVPKTGEALCQWMLMAEDTLAKGHGVWVRYLHRQRLAKLAATRMQSKAEFKQQHTDKAKQSKVKALARLVYTGD